MATSGDDAREIRDWREYDELTLPPVLQHSLDAMVEHGYHGTSVREIASRLGQTVPAIYYHYKNKQALLVALLQGSVEEVLLRCRLAVEEAGDDPVARLGNLVECFVLYITRRQPLERLDAEMRSLEPANRRKYVATRDLIEQLFVDAIRDGVDEGVFADRDPSLTTRAIMAMCHGIAVWYDPSGSLSPRRLAERYKEFAFGIVGARAAESVVLTSTVGGRAAPEG